MRSVRTKPKVSEFIDVHDLADAGGHLPAFPARATGSSTMAISTWVTLLDSWMREGPALYFDVEHSTFRFEPATQKDHFV